MRKIILISMITMDGVIQAPGSAREDISDGFTYGGWAAPYGDELYKKEMNKELNQQVDYLLGRKTFEIWEGYWPEHGNVWANINEGTKYVLSATRNDTQWKNTDFIRNAEDIDTLKKSAGKDIQVWGSSALVQLLLKNDLVDELRLKIFPLILGRGKHLFGDGTVPAAFTLTGSKVTSKGVILANYTRTGALRTGNIGN
ncbi:dihydrofolate reductase family protein [Sinomicrobium oceani]|nr:dihydrofolate reductase family protein [Sinomicrobium oceani]